MGKGLHHDPLADIELIRQNLKDRYGAGFPILKELIQNADDAGSTLAGFIWSPGIPDAQHQLLRGPGLVAFNNGRFSDPDRDAIRMMGLSDKLGQHATIGKFGLGLKSVFHWCEAFFYFASDQSGGQIEGDILNPWSSDTDTTSFHKDWDELKQADVDAAAAQLRHDTHQQSWFCLWIPLRKVDHCRGLAPIERTFPGDSKDVLNELTSRDTPRRLADTLPLLTNLRTIQIVVLADDGNPDQATEIELIDGSVRRQYSRSSDVPQTSVSLSGEIRIREAGRVTQLVFKGNEVLATNQALEAMKRSSSWPQSVRVDRQTGAQITVPEKADVHAAVVLISHPATGIGKLEIAWATFLPLGESIAEIACPGGVDYMLILHGDFFVDPGRQRPDFGSDLDPNMSSDGSSLRCRWNHTLTEAVVIPQILPMLRAVSENGTSNSTIKSLTQAVRDVFFRAGELSRWQRALVRDHQWAYCLSATGGSWRLLDVSTPLVGVPVSPRGPEQIDQTLPALRRAVESLAITFADWPRITSSPQLADWPVNSLIDVLTTDARVVFSRTDSLEYLVEFLGQVGSPAKDDRVQRKLLSLARTALQSDETEELSKHKSLVTRFLSFISPERLLPLDVSGSPGSQALYQSILRVPLQVLPIPHQFAPMSPRKGWEVGVDDAVSILQVLSSKTREAESKEQLRVISLMAVQILSQCDVPSHEILEQCRDSKLFHVHDCGTNRDTLISWQELREAKDEGRLFVDSETSSRSWIDALQQAINDTSIFLVKSDIAGVVFNDLSVTSCTPASAADLILRTRSLAFPEQRAQLLGKFLATLQADYSDLILRAIRYLLHAQPDHIENLSVPLFQDRATKSSVWFYLVDQALQLKREQWRLIPTCLSSRIAAVHSNELVLRDIDAYSVSNLLSEVGPERIDCTELTSEERDFVIREMDDERVLRRLVIHVDRNGQLRAIEPSSLPVYLEGDDRVDPVFVDLVTILARSKSPNVLAKQRRLLDVWSARSAVQVALSQPEPSRLAPQILDALSRLGGVNELRGEIRVRLGSSPWLLSSDQGALAPTDVLHIDGMDDEIGMLTAASDGTFFSVENLVSEIRSHRAFRYITSEMTPKSHEVLTMLGDIAQDFPEAHGFRIGSIRLTPDNLESFLIAFSGAPPELIPGHSLIHKAVRLVGTADCAQHLVPGLCVAISVSRLESVLEFLSGEYERGSHRDRQARRQIYDLYLESLARNRSIDLIKQLRLLNKRQEWRSVQVLCHPDTTGIADEFLVDPNQFKIIEPALPDQQGVAVTHESHAVEDSLTAQDYDGSAKRLRDYFRRWEGRCPRSVVAGFLGVLGDGPFRELAQEYFDTSDQLDFFRSRLKWRVVPGATGSGAWGLATSSNHAMRNHFVVIEIVDPRVEDGVEIENLLGDPIVVPPSHEIESLLIGRVRGPLISTSMEKPRRSYLKLREIDLNAHSERELSALLQETTRRFLMEAYRQRETNLDDIWVSLYNEEQKDIRITQNRVVSALLQTTRYLSLHHEAPIAEPLRTWDQADRLLAELQDSHGSDESRLRARAEDYIQRARDQLRKEITENEQVQHLFLNAVRKRLERNYQYRPDSIVFELFQNADDSVVELETMLQGDPLPPAANRFVLSVGDGKVNVAHWGRQINQFRRGDFDGRANGYDADLEKMLMLNASDKGASDHLPTVTGRYGLGFKSVFLFAERVQVLSGRLAFEVVGAMYPKQLESNSRSALEHRLQSFAPQQSGGTIIHLPASGTVSANQVVSRFTQLAQLLVVFSSRIKYCQIEAADGLATSVVWKERPVDGVDSVAIGQHSLADNLSPGFQKAVIVRTTSGALLLGLGSHGFRPFSSDVPTIWVTAPTNVNEDLGFLLNAHFDLDIGRAQLAADSYSNRVLATKLGHELAIGLRSLARLSASNWERFVTGLDLAVDADPYTFWSSLWALLADRVGSKRAQSVAVQVVNDVLWGQPNTGMRALIEHHDVIPTGLTGRYRALTRLERITFQVSGHLAGDHELFEKVSTWDGFAARVSSESIVSSATARTLNTLIRGSLNTQSLRLIDAVSWELNDSDSVNAELATRLGEVINKKLMEQLKSGVGGQGEEHTDLERLLTGLRFRSSAGTYRPPAEIVVDSTGVEVEERLRARFAPADQLLSDDYDGAALEFFLICRRRMQVNSRDLATWMRRRLDTERQAAALKYLAKGQLSREVAQHLRGNMYGTWLENVQSVDAMAALDSWDRNIVLALLSQQTPAESNPVQAAIYQSSMIDPTRVLENIHNWWEVDGPDQLRRYISKVFPNRLEFRIPGDWDGSRRDSFVRKEWLKLFLLGATFTIGLRREQHREFVEWVDRQGWLERFSQPRMLQRDPDLATNLIRDYLDSGLDRLDYYHWVRGLFIPLFQFSVWLDEYVENFLRIERHRGPFNLNNLLSPNANPQLSGSGVTAPPLRSTLGIGASFILRELVRGGHLKNDSIFPHCYVPSQSVRQFFLGINGPNLESERPRPEMSAEIHTFLVERLGPERALFGGAFDIPFYILAQDSELQQQLLGHSIDALEEDDLP